LHVVNTVSAAPATATQLVLEIMITDGLR